MMMKGGTAMNKKPEFKKHEVKSVSKPEMKQEVKLEVKPAQKPYKK